MVLGLCVGFALPLVASLDPMTAMCMHTVALPPYPCFLLTASSSLEFATPALLLCMCGAALHLQQAEVDMSKVGVGITKEAQSIFDALSKTMPCTWQGRTIHVMDVVLVEAPYTVDNVTTSSEHKGALERVKKVLQAERQRMGLA